MENNQQGLVDLGKYLSDAGYTKGSAGNLSLRLPSGDIIATPTNSNLSMLDVPSLSQLSATGEHKSGNLPTKEISFHMAIYENNPHCNAIIHLHSTYLTALSCLKNLDPYNVIKPCTPYATMRVGDVPLIPYFKPGSTKIAEAIAPLASKYTAFLLANHGVVVCGKDIKDACHKFEELEEAAKLHFILASSDVRYLSDAEIQELKGD